MKNSKAFEPKKRRHIARQYYQTPLTTKEIGDSLGVAPSAITQIANEYDWRSFKKDELDTVIKIKNEDLERILILLEESNIKYETPEKFELIEQFESKINN